MIGDMIGGLASLFGGVLGENAAADGRRMAGNYWDDYLRSAREQVGMDPYKALEFLKLTDKSAYGDMDPRAKEASMEALGQLLKRGSGSGLDTQSRVGLQQAIGQSGAASRAARQAVLQEYQQRGTGGSGAELASALQGNQQGYQDLSNASGQAAASSEQRRLEANVLASRAGQQQQQLEQQQANAMDALRRFNVGARQNTLSLQSDAMRNYYNGTQGAANARMGMAASSAAAGANLGNNLGGFAANAFSGLNGSNGNVGGGSSGSAGWGTGMGDYGDYGEYGKGYGAGD